MRIQTIWRIRYGRLYNCIMHDMIILNHMIDWILRSNISFIFKSHMKNTVEQETRSSSTPINFFFHFAFKRTISIDEAHIDASLLHLIEDNLSNIEHLPSFVSLLRWLISITALVQWCTIEWMAPIEHFNIGFWKVENALLPFL